MDALAQWLKDLHLQASHYVVIVVGLVVGLFHAIWPQFLGGAATWIGERSVKLFWAIFDRRGPKRAKRLSGFATGRMYQELKDVKKRLKTVERTQTIQARKLLKCEQDKADCHAWKKAFDKIQRTA